MPLNAALQNENLYGRMTLTGAREIVTIRKMRKAAHANTAFIHRTKNGVYDPLTYYHLLDAIMRLNPGQDFRTVELLDFLYSEKPQLVWDATTVGRCLTDMADSLFDTYETKPIDFTRRWNGMSYSVREAKGHRVMLHRLLDDLYLLCETTIASELGGTAPKRIDSPLNRCPSMLRQAASAV